MDSFVIAGKAHQIFALIALKSKHEQARQHFEHHVRIISEKALTCPVSPLARCDKPTNVTCEYIDCPVWLKEHGK